ncbi:MAG: glycosyltransferase family 4 protein [Planctomycetota bacterium]
MNRDPETELEIEKRHRVVVIFEHFGPYHVARCRGASEFLDVQPVELFGRCETYAWSELKGELDIKRKTLFENREPASVSKRELSTALCATLQRLAPDAVAVHGWSLPGAIATIKWCYRNRVPAVVMSESRYADAPRSFAKEFVKRCILDHVSAGLVGAKSHAEYLISLGMNEKAISKGYDAVDNSFFSTGARAARESAETLRNQLGLPEKYFFASGRFVEKKNFARLIEAYAMYRERFAELDQNTLGERQPWELVIAGDGPLRNQLKSLATGSGAGDSITFPGFIQYKRLPAYYGLASAFMHVSTVEQWGLVVNEAAAAGLPLGVSTSTGCADSLVVPDRNGWTCSAINVNDICSVMLNLSSATDQQRAEMGAASARIVDGYGPQEFGAGLSAATRYSIENVRQAGQISRLVLSSML